MENKKLTKLQHLQRIIYSYQEDYEMDKDNIWVKDFKKHSDSIEELSKQFVNEIDEYAYSAQYLGFIQGMNYALDLMNISGRGENKEILERFLRNIEYIDKSFGSITPRLNPDGSLYGVEQTTQNDLENGGTK